MRPPTLGRAPTSLSLSAQMLVQKHPHGLPRTVLKQTSGSRGPVSRTHQPSRLAPAGDTTITQISIVIAANYSIWGCGPTLRGQAAGLRPWGSQRHRPRLRSPGTPALLGGCTRSSPPHQAPGLCSEPHAAPLRQVRRLRPGRFTSLGPRFLAHVSVPSSDQAPSGLPHPRLTKAGPLKPRGVSQPCLEPSSTAAPEEARSWEGARPRVSLGTDHPRQRK